MSTPARSGSSRRYLVVAVVAVLAVLGGTVGPWAYDTFLDTSAKDRIEADPPPQLFSDHVVAPSGRQIAKESSRAATFMDTWWSQHDTEPHDTQFLAWLEHALPGPPQPGDRTAEVRSVQLLASTRTTTGVTAATWLEAYGKKDIWKLFAHDQAELVTPQVGERRKQEVKDMLSMSKSVADTLGLKYQQSAPYVLDPSLRPDHTVLDGQVCPCSYPSRHATAGAAARTYLSYFAPHRGADYEWMEEEIDYSRVYMAGHVPSDITGGALLGDMIGEYFLVSRHHVGVS